MLRAGNMLKAAAVAAASVVLLALMDVSTGRADEPVSDAAFGIRIGEPLTELGLAAGTGVYYAVPEPKIEAIQFSHVGVMRHHRSRRLCEFRRAPNRLAKIRIVA